MANNSNPPITAQGLKRLNMDPATSRVLVVGLGKTGLAVAGFLAASDIPFAVVDTRERPPGLEALQQNFPDAAVFLGGFDPAAFASASHLVVSPGVALDEPPIAALNGKIPVLGDLDLFACAATGPCIAITGSNGKSTVTTLLGLMAEADGKRVKVGGNLGVPMLDLLDASAELYVLELSSFQLERSELFEPDAATVLNISPDHMDRYPSLEAYAEAKARIFRGSGRMVLNRDDLRVSAMQLPGRRVEWFGLGSDSARDYGLVQTGGQMSLAIKGEPLVPVTDLRITGRHNWANALAAIALADAAGIGRDAMRDALRRFSGLDHRMQWVAEKDGVVWINDSKATNVGATESALAGLDRMAVLIAGGDGKGADFRILRPVIAEKVRAAILMGRDAQLLEDAIGDLVPIVRVANMREAVAAAHTRAESGDAVLLAPACASLDQYQDYQERGRMFADQVRSLLQ